MKTNVIMPKLGESVVEGTVRKWLKKQGDAISEFEPLLEVSTDKVDTEVPAPASGVVLAIYVGEGQTVEAGSLLAVIGQPGESVIQGDSPVGAAPGNTNGTASKTHAIGHVTPVVARMVAEHNLDLSQIPGSGRGGRVTKQDVEAFLKVDKIAPAAELAPWEQPGEGSLFKPTVEYTDQGSVGAQRLAPIEQATPQPTATPAPQRLHPVELIPQAAPGELVSLTPMRRLIAEHMVRSQLQTSPHVTTVFEIDMSAVVAHREANKADFAKLGVNLTLTAYFVTASVAALRANPYLNAEWRNDGIFLHHAAHIGIAVAIEGGLIVPVIKNAQDLNLMGTARTVNDLAARAREKRLKADETQGGTFTITNHGISGSLFATPIINQPQAGILGIGVMEKRVKVINDAIAIRPCVYASLSFDHRIADGATGDGFMLTLKQTLENWA
jgi:pyruvate/2-oxoglutarate dehydrogenase complex dihydrolipoamide acyltransferase (E2) component